MASAGANSDSNSHSSIYSSNSLPLLPIPNALSLLSDNLSSVVSSSSTFDFFADAKLLLPNPGAAAAAPNAIPLHRCILSARSSFFRSTFIEGKVELELKELLGRDDVEVSQDAVVEVLGYLYGGKVRGPLVKGVCECVDEECCHVACRPAVRFLVHVLFVAYVFQVSELVGMYQKHLLDILDKVAVDDILMVLSFANMCNNSCDELATRCVEILVNSDVDGITLDKALPGGIVKRITNSRSELGLNGPQFNSAPDKHVKRIHRALDSDDVELVRMLLKEARTTLDDACALHYAVAYCDAKTTVELLDLGIADVNCRNSRGYTVLHTAAMRKEPKIIISLLVKGARPSDLTTDGRKALTIAKRLTRAVDYYKVPEEGKSSPKERLCVEILEQAERRDPLLGEASLSLAVAGEDLRRELLYLENRVALAKLLFPLEAKVAMEIAQVDGTTEFPQVDIKKLMSKQGAPMDLNESPFVIQEEHRNRMRALSKTVELGKRFFPRCSAVINKLIDKDLSWIELAGDDPPEEQLRKRQKHMEVKQKLSEAFNQDKEEIEKSGIISSSSSTSLSLLDANGNLTQTNQ
ncbi:hypothetical protein MLD38_005830 [Melastoma candidum]|uniref:Uncharacterized protein n=1 Tax=Melastoma candidum TaxID=119954 RepID=A0ACB9RPN5_9MYRT|nr:hypothetical protein MLD38_005830 [Melastoma candidum]